MTLFLNFLYSETSLDWPPKWNVLEQFKILHFLAFSFSRLLFMEWSTLRKNIINFHVLSTYILNCSIIIISVLFQDMHGPIVAGLDIIVWWSQCKSTILSGTLNCTDCIFHILLVKFYIMWMWIRKNSFKWTGPCKVPGPFDPYLEEFHCMKLHNSIKVIFYLFILLYFSFVIVIIPIRHQVAPIGGSSQLSEG